MTRHIEHHVVTAKARRPKRPHSRKVEAEAQSRIKRNRRGGNVEAWDPAWEAWYFVEAAWFMQHTGDRNIQLSPSYAPRYETPTFRAPSRRR